MEDLTPSRAAPSVNISRHHPGLEQEIVQEFIYWNHSTAVFMTCSGGFG